MTKVSLVNEAMTDRNKPVRIVIEKAPSYRSLHSDGVMVTPNPTGNIVMSFYSERLRFPSELEMVQEEDGEFVENILGDSRGLFREISASVYLSMEKVDELISELNRAKDFLENGGAQEEDGDQSNE